MEYGIPSYMARLFGRFVVEQAGESVALPKSRKARHLLAYLLLSRKTPHPRLCLAGLFWPETDDAKARAALSHALVHLNRCLPGIIHRSPSQVQILPDAPVSTDVETFTRLVKAVQLYPLDSDEMVEQLREAVALYHDGLLPGVYDDWAIQMHDDLERQYEHALKLLLRMEKLTGDYAAAVHTARLALRIAPYQETLHEDIMHSLLRMNRPYEAICHFEAYHAMLEREFQQTPGAEPQRLVTLARQQTAELSTSLLEQEREFPSWEGQGVGKKGVELHETLEPTPHPSQEENLAISAASLPLPRKNLPLIGRRAEREQLLSHLDRHLCRLEPDTAHTLRCILIEGEPGIGKTRLCEEIARDAAWRGIEVLWGQGVEENIS